jgi:hypothetical protein
MSTVTIPKTQTVALVRELGGSVEFKDDYPVPTPGDREVLAKVLYTGVCQSGQSISMHHPFRQLNFSSSTNFLSFRSSHQSRHSRRC